jgi:hypothetical protein
LKANTIETRAMAIVRKLLKRVVELPPLRDRGCALMGAGSSEVHIHPARSGKL